MAKVPNIQIEIVADLEKMEATVEAFEEAAAAIRKLMAVLGPIEVETKSGANGDPHVIRIA